VVSLLYHLPLCIDRLVLALTAVLFSRDWNHHVYNIEYICQPDVEIFGDGTFKYCPRYFYQLYTLLGYKNGHAFIKRNKSDAKKIEFQYNKTINACTKVKTLLQLQRQHLQNLNE
jgi:hypothetical protein